MTPHRVHLLEMRASRPGPVMSSICPVCLGPVPAAYLCGACCASYDRAMPRDRVPLIVDAMAWAADRAVAFERRRSKADASAIAEPPADATARHLAEMRAGRAGREVQGG